MAIRCKKCIKINRCFIDIINGPSLVLFPPTPKSGSACHMTRLAIHRRHSAVIMSPPYILLCFSPLICCHISCVSVRSLRLSCRRPNTRRCPNVGLLLAHRLTRSADISRVLGDSVMFDATLNVGQRHRRRANITQPWLQVVVIVPPSPAHLNWPKSLKNKQKTATRHTGTLEWGTQQALVLTIVNHIGLGLAQYCFNV